ncbi:MAG: OmpA family protein [Pseudomonadota bacterium]
MARSTTALLRHLLIAMLLPGAIAHAEGERAPIWVPSDGPANWRAEPNPYASPDRDGDGVEDAVDRCPASRPNEAVALDGCMAIRDSLLGTIRFVNNSLGYASSTRAVRTAAAFKRRYPHARLLLVGHAVDGGSFAVQHQLGMRRANRVREALMRLGIDGNAILVRSAGPDEPIATNDTAGGRAQNRRVEIRTIPADLGIDRRDNRARRVRVYVTGSGRPGATEIAQAGYR